MSWIERIDTGMIIRTGDGVEYEPLYLHTTKKQEYNTVEFNFPGVDGTLVKRSERMGMRYNLEIVFQGENHLDTAEAFRVSANDKRYWVISHPMHGTLNMQPLRLNFDNSGINTSRITGEVVETIIDDAPKVTIDPREQTVKDVETVNEISAKSVSNRAPGMSATDKNLLTFNMDLLNDATDTVEKTDFEANEYFNLFKTVNGAIINYTAKPLIAMQAVSDFINYPSLLQISVQTRIQMLIDQFIALGNGIANLIDPNEKIIYENNAGNVITAMVSATVNPLSDDDYGNAIDVLSISDQLADTFGTYIENLDGLQTENGGDPNSYVPDFELISGISNLVDYGIANLFSIALNASQERSVILDRDSNAVILAHKYYGLDPADISLNKFIRNNKIGLNKIYHIPKGTKIIYYV
jgi:hypothetical protein